MSTALIDPKSVRDALARDAPLIVPRARSRVALVSCPPHVIEVGRYRLADPHSRGGEVALAFSRAGVTALARLAGMDYRCPTTIKDRLHHAVETMTHEEARAALRKVAEASGLAIRSRGRSITQLDDEAETEEEREAVAEARGDRERGIKPTPLADVLAEFGGA